ncbi:MAG: ferritin-like domain-containing protein [Campylobacterales bacterium]
MELFDLLEMALFEADPATKCSLTEQLWQRWEAGERLRHRHTKPLNNPSYASRFTLTQPGELKGRDLKTPEGRARLLHALAHIEYSAIDLALDAAYRFAGLPEHYYHDWLEVADEERRHYLILTDLLASYGVYHGDFPVHDALFQAMKATPTLWERMGVVPRFLEANGLDANIKLERKLASYRHDELVQAILAALAIIKRDEIGHVAKGDRWFRYACSIEQREPLEWFDLVRSFYPHLADKPVLAIKERHEAGFTCQELKRLGATECP